jgi:hypothetical protein
VQAALPGSLPIRRCQAHHPIFAGPERTPARLLIVVDPCRRGRIASLRRQSEGEVPIRPLNPSWHVGVSRPGTSGPA